MQRRLAPRLAAVLILASAVAYAADPDSISETKRQLMLELFELTGGERSADQLMEVMLAQMEQSQGAMIEQVVAGTSGLSPEQQSELREHLGGGQGFFAKFRTRLPERIDFRELMQGVVMPIYDRHFDEQDLREMVAFYRTAAGRKAVAILPQITQETMQGVAESVQPQILGLVQEIIAEEAAALGKNESS
jgi:uncharacterized protein